MSYFQNITPQKKLIIILVCIFAFASILFFVFNQNQKINIPNESFQYSDEPSSKDFAKVNFGAVYRESGGVPLEGAVVLASGKKFITDKNGFWASPEIPFGTNIKIFAYGYSPYEGVLSSDESFFLQSLPSVDMSVRVYDEDQKMMNDVFVIALDSNTKEPREILRPDQNGTAIFKNVPSGETIFFAVKKGYTLGWSISTVDGAHKTVSLVLKKRIPLKQLSSKTSSQKTNPLKFSFIDVAHAQDAGEEFEQTFPDEYRLIVPRDDNSAHVEGVELSTDDVADALEQDPSKKDWKSLGAEHLEFSDEIPEGYHLKRKIVDGKELFVVESEVYTESSLQKMFGLGVDYGDLSAEVQARKKVQAELGGRPHFSLSVFWNRDRELNVEYATGLYDTTADPVMNPISPVIEEGGGITTPATLYDTNGNIVTTKDVTKEFLNVAEKIYKGNPQFSLTVNGSNDPNVIVGEPFPLEANITLNHNPVPGWYILSPAALRGYFHSRWIDNPTQKFHGPGKIMPYLVQNAPHRDTQFSNKHTERKEFTCLDLGEETITYSFQVSYRFAPKLLDPRGFVQPGSSHYNYQIPITIHCVGPKLLSHNAPDQCGNPANVVISGRVGGEHMDILQNVEVYITKDGEGDVGSFSGGVDGGGSFKVSASLSPGFYYYWIFGQTSSGHLYRMNEYEGTFEVKDKKEGKEGCEDEEEPAQDVPVKTPSQPSGSSNCGDGGLWVCPR